VPSRPLPASLLSTLMSTMPSDSSSLEELAPSSAAPSAMPSRSSRSQGRAVTWILATLLIAFALVQLPEVGPWLGLKAFALETVGVVLVVLVVSRGEWTRSRVRAALLAGPNPFILGFLLWVGLSAALSPLPAVSRYEAMRHLGGGLVYFGVAYGVSRQDLGRLMGILALVGTLAALLALRDFGELYTPAQLAGAFRNVQLLAAFLCLLFPVALMASLTAEVPWHRNACQIAVVIIGAAMLIARNRSVWFAAGVALVVIIGLYLLTRREGVRLQKHQIIIPVVMVALSVSLFLLLSRSGDLLAARASTLPAIERDDSFRWRLGMWDKALRMVRDRPLTGWGVGLYPVQQALYYHPDAPTVQQATILRLGSTMAQNAHNTHLQLAAELGIPGFLLYLGVFVAFFRRGFRALLGVRSEVRRGVLIASLAAIAAQLVAGIGSPAWEFPECSLLLWLVMGMGMAAAGIGDSVRHSSSSSAG
jgi:O-antigen ligase